MPTYTYVYTKRETAVKARAMAKKLLRLKFPRTRIRARTTYFTLLLYPRNPIARERYTHIALPRFILHIELITYRMLQLV